MIATVVTNSAAPKASATAAKLGPEDPPVEVDGAALAVARTGVAEASGEGTTPVVAVELGAGEAEGEACVGASATYASVPSTG